MRGLVLIALGAAACGSDSSSPPDAALPDAAVSVDAAPMIDAEPNLTPNEACVLRYGSVPDFELCSANASTCTFFGQTDNRTCIEVCEAFGGLCINSHDGVCDTVNPTLQSCQSTDPDQVCICSLL